MYILVCMCKISSFASSNFKEKLVKFFDYTSNRTYKTHTYKAVYALMNLLAILYTKTNSFSFVLLKILNRSSDFTADLMGEKPLGVWSIERSCLKTRRKSCLDQVKNMVFPCRIK